VRRDENVDGNEIKGGKRVKQKTRRKTCNVKFMKCMDWKKNSLSLNQRLD